MAGQVKHDAMSPVERLRAAVTTFDHFVEELPKAALVEKVWGSKEVLAHLVFWLESYVMQVEAILAGKPPTPPEGRFDDINMGVVERSRGVSVDELLRRHQAACERLCRFAQTLDIDKVMLELTKGGVLHPLSWFFPAEASHIRDHQRILARQTERDPARETEQLRAAVEEFCRFIGKLPRADLGEQASEPKRPFNH